MSEEMQLELEHTLKTMRELKEAKAEIERLRRTSEYWKTEHLAGNAEIERLRAFAKAVIRYAGNAGDDYLADKARAALAEEKPHDR